MAKGDSGVVDDAKLLLVEGLVLRGQPPGSEPGRICQRHTTIGCISGVVFPKRAALIH